MEKNKTHDIEAIQKVGDTLLVLHHKNNTIGLVNGVDPQGQLKEVLPQHKGSDEVLHIEANDESFAQFFSYFYNQLKNPSDFSFFKVTEYDAVETAKELQAYVTNASKDEKEVLKEYEVSIDAVKDRTVQSVAQSFDSNKVGPPYRYQIEQINWGIMEKFGLNQEKLEKLNAMEPLLKGYKTPHLIPVKINFDKAVTIMDARLSLQCNDVGEVEPCIHGIRKEPDLNNAFFGHIFMVEDKKKLLETGNMGRIVNLINPKTDEVIPSVISRDRLTNELVAWRSGSIRVPLVICGVTLNEVQKKTLKEGKVLFMENMLSKKGTLFNSNVQFNADKGYVEFLFKKNIKSLRLGDLGSRGKGEVPTVFRGKTLLLWQMDRLKAGETAYVDGLVDGNGKKYQGYLRFDNVKGRLEFSFRNEKKEKINKSDVTSKGRKL